MGVFVVLELGFRVYYAFRTPPAFHLGMPTVWEAPKLSSSTSPFALPTSIAQKAIHKSPLDNYQPEQLDNTNAYFKVAQRDDLYTFEPNHTQELIEKVKGTGEIIYKVTMSTDALGRRITPIKGSRPRNKHLVFYGCSYTVGEGMGQEETIPYFTAAATKNYRAYNLAVNGGNVSEAWTYTHYLDKLKDIPEKKGYAFYIFFDDHVPRYKGNVQNLSMWIYTRPLVRPEADGTIHYYGLWRHARPLAVGISQLLSKSVFLRAIQFNFPPIYPQDLEDYVKVLVSIRQGYWDKFGSDNPFVIVFYFNHASHLAPLLKPLLEREHIPYLDYSSIFLGNMSNERLTLPYDGHPNALAHKILGEQIAEDLKLE